MITKLVGWRRWRSGTGATTRLIRAFDVTGSTRALALVRILLVCTLWSQFGWDLLLYRARHPLWVVIGAVFFVATPFLLVGLYTRVAAVLTAVTLLAMMFVVGPLAGHADYPLHTVFLIVLSSLLALTPCDRSFSLARHRAVVQARARSLPIPDEQGALWATRLMMATVTIVALIGAVEKLTWNHLSGAQLRDYFAAHLPQVSLPTMGMMSGIVDVAFAGWSVGWLVLDVAIAFGLYFARVRLPLIVVAAALHIVLYLVVPVSTFPATMLIATLVFLDPDAFHRFIDEITARGDDAVISSGSPTPIHDVYSSDQARRRRALRGLALAGCAIAVLGGPFLNQVLLPRPRNDLPGWRMFSGKSRGACQTEFKTRSRGGDETRLNRFETLNVGRYAGSRRSQTLKSDRDVEKMAARLCQSLNARNSAPDVRVYRRCAHKTTGWETKEHGERNHCAPPRVPANDRRERMDAEVRP